jgi:hypothetical protein
MSFNGFHQLGAASFHRFLGWRDFHLIVVLSHVLTQKIETVINTGN